MGPPRSILEVSSVMYCVLHKGSPELVVGSQLIFSVGLGDTELGSKALSVASGRPGIGWLYHNYNNNRLMKGLVNITAFARGLARKQLQ